jgi:hypothetical protein
VNDQDEAERYEREAQADHPSDAEVREAAQFKYGED